MAYNPTGSRFGAYAQDPRYPPLQPTAMADRSVTTSPPTAAAGGGGNTSQWASPPPVARPSPKTSPLVNSELTSTAAPFVPKQHAAPEPMVQVTRGGCIFYVPESEAKATPTNAVLRHGPGAQLHVDIQPPYAASASVIPSSPIVTTRRSLASMALAPTVRRQLDAEHEDMLRQVHPSDERYKEIPSQFHCMWPLDVQDDALHRNVAGSFGYPSHCYKVISETDGRTYALRRVENVRTTPGITQQAVDKWKKVVHANVVPSTARSCPMAVPPLDGNDDVSSSRVALFFLSEYFPTATSLHAKFFTSQASIASEAFLWSLLTQMAGALRAIHRHDMACQAIGLRRLLVTGHNRVRISGTGVLDVLEYDTSKSKRVEALQQEDLINLGKVVLSLGVRQEISATTNGTSMRPLPGLMLARLVTDLLSQFASTFSDDLTAVVRGLTLQETASATELALTLFDRTQAELDAQYSLADELEAQLSSEYQNGRMLLLMLKLGLINERPDLNMDSSWAETGDRYLLKLFRDFVFHQVDEENRPVLDFGHIVDALNKLDGASAEKVLLSSRDGQSVLVASYAEVHKCVKQAFSELVAAAQRQRPSTTPLAKPAAFGGRATNGRGRGRGRG
ncbi:hypothetical protein SPRG_11569 [Saprolegnia parasitica CBS 223.65]|uniref:Pan3 C-terminal knob domain-containing protein n=1 Tax=Saprolegnia parasitica (strain CBS 223.65) TaxID=695850 RepID=A0A067C118_SAPPC|nr:hypothetical protein SPRG_11569 [Saprolegnia parasitica CBS 223.65]KDO22810.1 hypothetical protein SPRG_11569 [Saprolegnia parasitica CBS 223.65]|eukprot:XP_012206481.1 hypothetical protein SPRG_11569 [Saprolegnia parasitica CBS 223.65]